MLVLLKRDGWMRGILCMDETIGYGCGFGIDWMRILEGCRQTEGRSQHSLTVHVFTYRWKWTTADSAEMKINSHIHALMLVMNG